MTPNIRLHPYPSKANDNTIKITINPPSNATGERCGWSFQVDNKLVVCFSRSFPAERRHGADQSE